MSVDSLPGGASPPDSSHELAPIQRVLDDAGAPGAEDSLDTVPNDTPIFDESAAGALIVQEIPGDPTERVTADG